ncbi:hypothetical protein [Yoonia sp.]|uniref:hypothetical protein n=1 Tax=Yoonia sp. TaxID=2212373 RepID=UPI0025DCCCA4|nr:hypothetical protein [Yoonia sp.]
MEITKMIRAVAEKQAPLAVISDYFSNKNKEDHFFEIKDLIEKALKRSPLEPLEIEALLYALSCNRYLDNRYTHLLCKLLEKPDILPYNLEFVVELLQYIKDGKSAKCISNAIALYPPSDTHSIPTKCMWALRDIGTAAAVQYLKELALSENEKIAILANQQLQYVK